MDTLTVEYLSFKELMTGGMPLHYWFALFIFYLIGANIYQATKVSKGITENPLKCNCLVSALGGAGVLINIIHP